MGIFSKRIRVKKNEIPAICDVKIERYLGTWYEIARLPHRFEEGLDNVTATYNLRPSGKIEVINSGTRNGKRSNAKGRAWIPDKKCTGRLLVSFFGPFKGEYNIIKLDKEYSYVVVTGSSKNYLWILSRVPKIADDLYEELISYVSSLGFDPKKIIKVNQSIK